MKISKIIFSSDDNPNFLNFWRLNSELCVRVLGIEPVLFKIGNENSDFINDKFGIIKTIKRIENIPTSFQAQVCRMYFASLFPQEACITSDIDMFLFSKKYIDYLNYQHKDTDILIASADGYDQKRPEVSWLYPANVPIYPMMYNVALGGVYKRLLFKHEKESFSEYCNRLYFEEFKGSQIDKRYEVDEFYYGKMIDENRNGFKIKKLNRGYMSSFFLADRIEKYDFFNGTKEVWKLDLDGIVDYDRFIDCHCPPYEKYPDRINKVFNDLIKKYSC